MRIGDDQLHAAQAALDQALEEGRPKGLGLRRADVQADDLAVPLGIAGHSDYRRHRHDAAALALAQVGRVEPEIGPIAGQRPIQEGANPLVDVCSASTMLSDADNQDGWCWRLRQSVQVMMSSLLSVRLSASASCWVASRLSAEVVAGVLILSRRPTAVRRR